MKKILYLIVVLFCVVHNSNAQITYETSYSAQPLMLYFNHMSPKWMTRATAGNAIYLYNLNHSLYTTINIPSQPANFAVAYITEDLFDTDSTNLEYLIASVNTQSNFVKIYRQDGTLLFQRDSAWMTCSAILTNIDYRSNIVPTDSGTKMFVGIYTPYYNHSEVYSLPGVLPCPSLCGSVAPGGSSPLQIEEAVQKNFNNPYPNPSSSQIRLPYQLPQGETSGEIVFYDLTGSEVKRYKVDTTFSELILTTSDLVAGSYYYQLQTPHSKSEGKKLIVIK